MGSRRASGNVAELAEDAMQAVEAQTDGRSGSPPKQRGACPCGPHDPVDEFGEDAVREAMEEALWESVYRDDFEAVELDGVNGNERAQERGVSPAAISSNVARARSRIHHALEGSGGVEGGDR